MKYTMRLLAVLIVALCASLLQSVAQTGAQTMFRFVHVVPGVAAIDIYIDGALSVHALDYGEASGYIAVDAGSRTIVVRPSGLTTDLWSQPVEALPDSPSTMIASTIDPLGFVPYQDDFTGAPLGTTRFKAIHAISGAPEVDVYAGEDVIGSAAYNGFLGTFDVPADTYQITIVASGDSVENAIIPTTGFDLASNTTSMLIVYGTPSIPETLLLEAPLAHEADGGFLRLAHAVGRRACSRHLHE